MEERSTKKMYKARDKKEQRTDMRDKREQRKIQALFCVNGQAQREICLLYLPCHYLSTNEGRGFPEGGTKLCWLHPCLDLVVSVIKRLQYHSKEQRRQEAKAGWKEKHRSTNEKKKKFRKKNSKKTDFFFADQPPSSAAVPPAAPRGRKNNSSSPSSSEGDGEHDDPS